MLSYWERTSNFASPTDLLIVGSGLTGMLTARLYLDQYPNRSIRIVERGPFPFGASTRNAGFACFGSPSELLDDFNQMGEDATLQRVEKRFKGLAYYNQHFEASKYGYQQLGGFEVFQSSELQVVENLISDVPRLNSLLKNITQCETYAVDKDMNRFGMNFNATGFVNTLEGQLHPGKLCSLLYSDLLERGVNFSIGVEIVNIEASSKGVILEDKHGIEWKAEKCVVATNGLTKALLPSEDIEPARGQVLLTSPIRGLKVKGTFHYDCGYYYFRNVGDRLLLGGGRQIAVREENTTSRDTSPIIQKDLEALLKSILPNIQFDIEMRWAGTMAFGSKNEKAPRVEALSENLVVAARLGGMGVAIAPEVARETLELLT